MDGEDPTEADYEEAAHFWESQELQLRCSTKYRVPTTWSNHVGIKFVLVPNGTFVMGSPLSEQGRCLGERQHVVGLTTPFYLSVYPITQGQYKKVLGINPSHFQGFMESALYNIKTENHPVDSVSWVEANRFCNKLSKAENCTYRLPTEAEWEYACRAGRESAFSFRGEIDELDKFCLEGKLSYNGNLWNRTTHPVGRHEANAWGLRDMHGNVLEWVFDLHAPYGVGPSVDPGGGKSGNERVLRGGCYASELFACRSASRLWRPESFKSCGTGFRIIKQVS